MRPWVVDLLTNADENHVVDLLNLPTALSAFLAITGNECDTTPKTLNSSSSVRKDTEMLKT
jgi:hypothetical protein